ncbi:hypothetical protein GCM10011342_20190 [Aquisalinus flavus]|uniref:EF-hand domain-containing protein n=2 Tax=Aquisalinus flavus TaxID=1526572 RepID=A0A8J2V3D0_9PROT|nr:hypothetical protein GCM10011342_20190 [Aquisalinus flavus]
MTVKTAIQTRLFALAGTALMLAAAGPASAQTAERLAEADANGDGNISWQEMLDMRAATFDRLDRNGDGFIDSADRPRIKAAQAKFDEAFASLEDADVNGDGRISKSEMLDAPAPMFEKGDIDGDKVLTAEELSALREQASEQR